MIAALRWAPAVLLGIGALAAEGVDSRGEIPLRSPLPEAVPIQVAEYRGRDVEISEEERRVAGMTEYVARSYEAPAGAAGAAAFSLYVGYYASQTRGRTIHSPKNCLPGSGWEALASQEATLQTASGPVTVNRYLLQRGQERALVLYWYQGRGRVEANEYVVKWDLLRDSLLRGRSEEALVRIMVPVSGTEEEAFRLAAGVAGTIRGAVDEALPS